MSDFSKLLRLLESEITHQEKILDVLSRERAAIVKLNREDLDALRLKKDQVLGSAREVGQKREQCIAALVKGQPTASEPLKLKDLLALCLDREIKSQIQKVGDELKVTAIAVQKMNSENGELLKQTLGLVASTIAIFQSAPGTDLPTYNESGTLKSSDDPAFQLRRSSVSREA